MSIPPKSAPVWRKLVTGEVNHKFSFFAANMVIGRCGRNFKLDPSSLAKGIEEIHEYFEKHADQTADELLKLSH